LLELPAACGFGLVITWNRLLEDRIDAENSFARKIRAGNMPARILLLITVGWLEVWIIVRGTTAEEHPELPFFWHPCF
jgi:hypothetical protein